MRSPPLAPGRFRDLYCPRWLGKLGRGYREVDEEYVDKATVIRNINEERRADHPRNSVERHCVTSRHRPVAWPRGPTRD
jgi:hypothetical protein